MTLLADQVIKRNDVGKIISGQLLDANGQPPDFTGYSSAKIFMRSITDGTIKINGATFTFTDPALAKWSYALQAGDVNASGFYEMELEVVKAGATSTFPASQNKPYLIVQIIDDLG